MSMVVVLLSGCALFETVGPVQAVIHDDHKEIFSIRIIIGFYNALVKQAQ